MAVLKDGSSGIEYIVRDRQEGKTSRLVEWVREGTQIAGALGWGRIIVVNKEADRQRLLRGMRARNEPYLQEGQVITLRMLNQGYGYNSWFDKVEFALDDVDGLLRDEMPRFWHQVRLVTVNGFTHEAEIATLRWAQEHPEEIEERIALLSARSQHLSSDQGALIPPEYPPFGPIFE